jgi:hypothetical protein
MEFRTVSELIEYLKHFEQSKYVMIDDGGDTYPLSSEMIRLWDENLEDSPVAIFVG